MTVLHPTPAAPGRLSRLTADAPFHGRGLLASVVASSLFGVIFLFPAFLQTLSPDELFAWRVVVSLPVVAVLLHWSSGWTDILAIVRRVRSQPATLLLLVLHGLLLGVQLWLFTWAPRAGHGLDAALGYLLLPLVMVASGVVFHRERLSRVRVVAVSFAAAGVGAATVFAGGLSWVTVVVAAGYPLYFISRRRCALEGAGALASELVVLLPFCMWLLARSDSVVRVVHSPGDLLAVVGFGVVSGVALMLYLTASRLLPFGLFGLLTYLEPVLLVVVALVFLGEKASATDLLVYGPIVVALTALAVEPLRRQ